MRISFLSTVLTLLSLANVSAIAEETILIRPHAGIGSFERDVYQHVGLRLLLNANTEKKYGFELTRILTTNADYTAAGIVLEQKKFGWFNMSIGTIGYFGRGSTTPNQPGMVLNLGWEPDTTSEIKPFVTFRNDVIFADKTISGHAISAGLSIIY